MMWDRHKRTADPGKFPDKFLQNGNCLSILTGSERLGMVPDTPKTICRRFPIVDCIITEYMTIWIFGNTTGHWNTLKLLEIPQRPPCGCRDCLARPFSPSRQYPQELFLWYQNLENCKIPKFMKMKRRVPKKDREASGHLLRILNMETMS